MSGVEEGRKFDGGKDRWDLVPVEAMRGVVRVLTFGAEKYGADNWKHVCDAESRYFAAAQRHLWAWRGGEELDAESGLPHLAHAACCMLFLLHNAERIEDSDDSATVMLSGGHGTSMDAAQVLSNIRSKLDKSPRDYECPVCGIGVTSMMFSNMSMVKHCVCGKAYVGNYVEVTSDKGEK